MVFLLAMHLDNSYVKLNYIYLLIELLIIWGTLL